MVIVAPGGVGFEGRKGWPGRRSMYSLEGVATIDRLGRAQLVNNRTKSKLRMALEKTEVDLDSREDGDGRTAPGAGLETPLLDGRNRFRIEAETGGTEDVDVLRVAAGINFDREDSGSGELGRAGLLTVRRLYFGQEFRRQDVVANSHRRRGGGWRRAASGLPKCSGLSGVRIDVRRASG